MFCKMLIAQQRIKSTAAPAQYEESASSDTFPSESASLTGGSIMACKYFIVLQ